MPEDSQPQDQEWGMTDDEIAAMPTVYRSDLFEGQVALVSGAGSGLGRGIAHLFARLGASLVVCGRRSEPIEEMIADVQARYGTKALAVPMTIRDPEAVQALIDRTYEEFGQLDVLVNNGGGQFPKRALDLTVNGWNAVIDTNLNGTWYMMQTAAKRWVADGKTGNIINIVADFWRGMPQIAHTAAARAGVTYLTRSVAVEWAEHKIRVNCVAPGMCETEGFQHYPEGTFGEDRMVTANAMRQFGDVHDIAEACVYLAAPSAKFITGECLTVDGGQQLWGDWWPHDVPDYFKK